MHTPHRRHSLSLNRLIQFTTPCYFVRTHPFRKPLYPIAPPTDISPSSIHPRVAGYLKATRSEICKCRARVPPNNLSPPERMALDQLVNNKNLVITKVDKGDTIESGLQTFTRRTNIQTADRRPHTNHRTKFHNLLKPSSNI